MVILADILQRQAVWRGGALAEPAVPAAPTGYAGLDAELPGGGWPAGGLVEILCRAEGIGELQVVLPALAALTAAGHRIAWLAPPYLPYAPALRAAGVRLERLTVVRAPGRRDALWAAEQALRARSFHALLLWLPRASYPELRRLAVAAQGAPGFVLAFRPPEAACESSPAVLRLALQPGPESELKVCILKRRGAPIEAPFPLPIERPFTERPAHALGRAPFSAAPAPGAVARACAA
ncbi:MAG TPA: translesion DNA synthesis-associated protein ImuA [Burkholderiales bacterium]|nr:translesion DNA synthesis-associated protein ImuA [Burkholderiales bacterium]